MSNDLACFTALFLALPHTQSPASSLVHALFLMSPHSTSQALSLTSLCLSQSLMLLRFSHALTVHVLLARMLGCTIAKTNIIGKSQEKHSS